MLASTNFNPFFLNSRIPNSKPLVFFFFLYLFLLSAFAPLLSIDTLSLVYKSSRLSVCVSLAVRQTHIVSQDAVGQNRL